MDDHPIDSPTDGARTEPARLPASAGERRLPAVVLRLWHLTTVLTCLVLVGLIVAVVHWWDHPWGHALLWPALGLVAVIGVADLVVGNHLRHRGYSYTVSSEEVYVAKGVLVRHTMDLAVPQVLSVHVTRGPLQRLMGLSSVRFACVVEGESLGPVHVDEAERIKTVVLQGLELRRQESLRALAPEEVPS